MAQTNYTPISLYYSTTASAVPTAANLVPGELAINTNDGKLYYEDSSGVVQVLATKSTGSIGGSNTQVQFNNSGSLGGSSSFTWDGTTVTATKFAGALNGTVGATTASTGAFTTLTSNGATTFTAGTASTSTTTGTTVITGGLGVSGRINAANFDGIVGANTAAAGSFSTLSATGVATFSAGTVSLPAITTTGDTNTGIYFPAADTIAFTEGGVESMRIDSSGNLGLGVTPVASVYAPSRNFFVGQASNLIGRTTINFTSLNTNVYEAPTTSAPTYINSSTAATQYIQYLGQHIWNTAPSGTAGNAITFTQAMTLDSSGNLLIGKTSATVGGAGTWFEVPGDITTMPMYLHFCKTFSGLRDAIDFNYSGTRVGSIQFSDTATLYNVTSDQRVKINIVNAPSGNIDDIKVRSFDWIADGSHQKYGMVAQELIEVAPYAVSKPKNPDEMMGVDYSKLVPMMIKEIQDLKQRIATLENK